MKKSQDKPADAAELRRRAEKRLKEKPTATGQPLTEADLRRLLQELEVHQIELEMQNEELQQAQVEIEAGLEKYTDLYDFAPTGYFTLERDGAIRQLNLTGARLLGVERSRLVNRRFGLFVSDDSRPAFNALLKKVFESQAEESCEATLLKEGNHPYYVDIEARVSEDGQECRAAVADITERKRAEEALKESEKRYRQVVENATEIIYALDEKGNFTYGNPTGLKVTGYSLAELRSFNYADLVLPEHRERVMEIYINQFRQRIPTTHVEFPFLSKTGKIIWFEQNTSLVIEDGKVVGFHIIARDITERKRAEEALGESEEKYRTIIEIIEEGYYEVDLAGNFTFVNDTVSKHLGYSAEELIGMNYRQYWDEKTARELYQAYNTVYSTGQPSKRLGVQLIRKDGPKRFFEILASLIKNSEGKPIGFRGVSWDVTERKKAEEALKESEEKYRLVVENANEAIFVIQDGMLRFFNIKNIELIGYSKEELTSTPFINFVHPDDREVTLGRYLKRIRGEELPGVSVLRIIDKAGNIKWAEINSVLISWEGRPATLNFLNDITERKQAEEALRISEEKYRTILENIEDGYFEVDIAGNFTFFNDSICRIYGYPREELMGMNNRQYTDQENAKKLFQTFNKVYRMGESTKEFDWEIIRKDGKKRSIEASVSLMKDPSGNRIGFRGIVRDITERKRIEQEKANLEEQLRQSQKIEAIGRLASGIAHDFNNLLTVIKGYSQLSLIELKEDVPLRGNIEEIKRASDRAADLTRQLLAFSRRQILEMRVLDLNTVLRDLDKMLHRLIGEDIELVTVFTDDLGRVKTDPGWVGQVIMNLAVNARDAMPSVGKLTIETANVELDGAYARNHIAVTPGRYVMLSVSDTGVGMTPEVRQQIFEPFFTTKEKGKGTGLGLSTVYGIVKQSGGNMWVYSEPGKGTTFKIYLPRVDEPLEELGERVEVKEIPRGTETILVVEDEEDVRKLAVRILERQGYKVLEASQGLDAFLIAEKYEDLIHLLVTDVVMPKISGRELADRIAEIRLEIKVLYMSGYTDNAIVHHGVLGEGRKFIQKPFTVDGLARKVRELLDK